MERLEIIVALNIQHGGGKRTAALAEWLLKQNASIIVLSEWRDNRNGLALASTLKSRGYFVHGQDGAKTNGVLIAAREAFDAMVATPPVAEIGVLLAARWRTGLSLMGAYFPLDAASKRQFFEVCTNHACQHSESPFLLVGDLNTGRNDVDLSLGATRFPCADVFASLPTSGLFDQWRTEHGETARDYSWRSRHNGFRIDHALANTAFQTSYPRLTCEYDHTPWQDKLTDHSALILRSV